jgi:hypothetical protein
MSSPAVFQGVVVPTPSPVFQMQNYSVQPNQFQRVLITAAQLLALNGAPVIIAPAAGAGTLLVPDSVSYRYIFNSVAYTIGTAVLRLYLGSVIAGHALHASVATGLVDQVANRVLPNVVFTTPTTVDTDANYLNQPIVLGNDNATQLTLGNGTLQIMLEYSTLTVF